MDQLQIHGGGATTNGLISNINVSAGTTSNNLSAITFSNANGISFGLAGSTVTGSHNALTTAMASNRGSDFVQATAAFAGTSASGTINSTGISVSIGPYLTTAMASNRGTDFVQATAAFAGTSASGTIASGGISVSIGPYITTAMLSNAVTLSNIRLSAGTTSNLASAFTFGDANGISFGLNASTITGSHNALTSQSNQAASASNGSFAFQTIAFSNANNVTFGTSAGSIVTASVAAAGAVTFSAGTSSAAIASLVFSNSNGVSFGLNGSTITGSVAAGAAAAAKSYFNWPEVIANSSAVQISGSSKYLQPIEVPHDLSVSFMRMPCTFSCAGSMASIATTANHTLGLTISSTIQLAFYSLGVGANSLSLQSYFTTSTLWLQQAQIRAGAVGSNWTSAHTISYPNASGANSSFGSSAGTTLTNRTLSSGPLTNFTNLRFLHIPMATSFSAGMYWMAYNSSTSMSTSGNASISNVRILASNMAVSQPAQSINVLGQVTSSSNAFPIGQGSWSTNTIGTTTGSIQLAAISRAASNPILYFDMIRIA